MKNKIFLKTYNRLPRANKTYAKIRDLIIKKCEITQSIFYNWQQGITEIPEHHKPTISEIMNKPISELFPEHETVL